MKTEIKLPGNNITFKALSYRKRFRIFWVSLNNKSITPYGRQKVPGKCRGTRGQAGVKRMWSFKTECWQEAKKGWALSSGMVKSGEISCGLIGESPHSRADSKRSVFARYRMGRIKTVNFGVFKNR
ncbi:MAG TPA: hypothetical protein DDW50_08050 [Firmicutes bacterium]|nr:hypothetical protein [Bacillota bacterium]